MGWNELSIIVSLLLLQSEKMESLRRSLRFSLLLLPLRFFFWALSSSSSSSSSSFSFPLSSLFVYSNSFSSLFVLAQNDDSKRINPYQNSFGPPLSISPQCHARDVDWDENFFCSSVPGTQAFASIGKKLNVTNEDIVLSHVDGYVSIKSRGQLTVKIKIKNIHRIPGGEECFKLKGKTLGLKFYVGPQWTHVDGMTWATGKKKCAKTFVGGHWDPTLACSSKSWNIHCDITNWKSRFARSMNRYAYFGGYLCNPENYRERRSFGCEIGDFSRKYGNLNMTKNGDEYLGILNYTDPLLYNWCHFAKKSVVFQCQDKTPAFCMMFEIRETLTEEEKKIYDTLQ